MNYNKNKKSLFKLYLCYALQRATLIILLISILCLTGILVVLCNPFIDMDQYYISYKPIHYQYINNAIYFIELFNSIIISSVVITLTINSKQFDVLFIADIKRKSICTIKLLAVFLILLLLVSLEVGIAITIPLLIYPNFQFQWVDLLLIAYILIIALIEVFVAFGIVTMIQNQFISPLISFLFITLRTLCNSNTVIYEKTKYFLPIITYNSSGPIMDSMIPILPIFLIFITIYLTSYTIKDIK